MTTNKEKIDVFLFYLSEIHTKSLSLYDLVTSKPRVDDERILLNINEVFTYYHSARILYFTSNQLEKPEVEPFFSAFEEFYFELKQLYLQEDDNNTILYNKLSAMKDYFEELTNSFNVL